MYQVLMYGYLFSSVYSFDVTRTCEYKSLY